MKRYLFRKVVYDCKHATLLALKREHGKISVAEKVKLFYHLLHCDSCRFFINQSRLINQIGIYIGNFEVKKPTHKLSEERKKSIQNRLNAIN